MQYFRKNEITSRLILTLQPLTYNLTHLYSALAGTVVFLGKYMENQYSVSPGVSNMLRGTVEIPLVCVAIFSGGYMMKR